MYDWAKFGEICNIFLNEKEETYGKHAQRGFRTVRRIEERFCISPLENHGGGSPLKSENPQILGVFWGSYYTVIRRDSLSTV